MKTHFILLFVLIPLCCHGDSFNRNVGESNIHTSTDTASDSSDDSEVYVDSCFNSASPILDEFAYYTDLSLPTEETKDQSPAAEVFQEESFDEASGRFRPQRASMSSMSFKPNFLRTPTQHPTEKKAWPPSFRPFTRSQNKKAGHPLEDLADYISDEDSLLDDDSIWAPIGKSNSFPKAEPGKPRGRTTKKHAVKKNIKAENSRSQDYTDPQSYFALIRASKSKGGEIITCGGTLVHIRAVLTAAHCVHNYDKIEVMLFDTLHKKRISHEGKAFVNEDYLRLKGHYAQHNYALVRLPERLDGDAFMPLTFAADSDYDENGRYIVPGHRGRGEFYKAQHNMFTDCSRTALFMRSIVREMALDGAFKDTHSNTDDVTQFTREIRVSKDRTICSQTNSEELGDVGSGLIGYGKDNTLKLFGVVVGYTYFTYETKMPFSIGSVTDERADTIILKASLMEDFLNQVIHKTKHSD